MDKNDYKKLDVERAQMTVAIQAARDLVSQWIDPDFADTDGPDEAFVPTLMSSTAGLGFKQPEAAAPENKALSKLKRLHKDKQDKPSTGTRRDVRGGPRAEQRGGSKADPKTDSKSESASEDESESRGSIQKPKRSVMTAMDAYRQSKKRKK